MTNPSFDNSIPELTEVIVANALEMTSLPIAAEIARPTPRNFTPPVPSEPHSAATTNHETPPTFSLADWPEEEWQRMEAEIRERIARQVLARIDFVLEQRVRDSLADVLQTAVESLANDIKHGLQTTLEEVIGRAVAQEITRLKNTKI